MEKILFVDLDDTLFQSLVKCPSGSELTGTTYLSDGRAHSFMTGKQRVLWRLLEEQLRIIPVTARNGSAFRRVKLPFKDWVVLNFGGVLLDPTGLPDAGWMDRQKHLSGEYAVGLEQFYAAARLFAERERLSLRLRIVEDYGLPFYFLGKYQDRCAVDLDRLQAQWVEPWLREQDDAYYLHRNGNNLAVLPAGLGKHHAVRYLIERLGARGEVLTFGLGDSQSDAAFMAECDYLMTPRGSQLFDRGVLPLMNPVTA